MEVLIQRDQKLRIFEVDLAHLILCLWKSSRSNNPPILKCTYGMYLLNFSHFLLGGGLHRSSYLGTRKIELRLWSFNGVLSFITRIFNSFGISWSNNSVSFWFIEINGVSDISKYSKSRRDILYPLEISRITGLLALFDQFPRNDVSFPDVWVFLTFSEKFNLFIFGCIFS